MKNKYFYKYVKYNVSFLFLLIIFIPFTMPVNTGDAKEDLGYKKWETDNNIILKLKSAENPQTITTDNKSSKQSLISYYQKNTNTEYVEPEYIYRMAIIPNDSYATKQWYFKKIKAYDAWDVIRESKDIVVAVVDSGVQISHPDLRENIWINKKEIPNNGVDDDKNGFIDDVNGWDFVGNTYNPSPKFDDGYTENGIMHGTVVAGIISASGNNAAGTAGVTWRSQIMSLRVLDGKGEGSTSKVVKAIDYATLNGADIINLSFVGFGYSKSIEDAIKRAYNAGVLVVAAAGNEQSDGEGYNIDDVPMYPACNDGPDGVNRVIGVAALDTIDQKAKFSSYGSRCVDISAPGVSIYSTTVYNPDKSFNGKSLTNYYDGYWSGTSMAAPMVSGALALIEEVNPGLSHSQVMENLFKYTDNINRLNPTYIGKLGSGRLNIFLATHFAEKLLSNKISKLFYSTITPTASSTLLYTSNSNGTELLSYSPYGATFHGVINAAIGNIEGDGNLEQIVAPGPGSSGAIKIFDYRFKLKNEFKISSDKFKGGINLSIGDVNGDGINEIVASYASNELSLIKVINNKGTILSQFFAYDKKYTGGVNIATGDVDGDGIDEIITAPNKSSGPQVKVFKMSGKLQNQFFAYDKKFRGGVKVATARVTYGARGNRDRIITAPISGGGPHVRIFNSSGVLENQFFAFAQSFRGGVSLATSDINKDGFDEIITGAGPGGSPHIRLYNSSGELLDSFYGLNASYQGGVNIFANKY